MTRPTPIHSHPAGQMLLAAADTGALPRPSELAALELDDTAAEKLTTALAAVAAQHGNKPAALEMARESWLSLRGSVPRPTDPMADERDPSALARLVPRR